jgi:hypothetical protein
MYSRNGRRIRSTFKRKNMFKKILKKLLLPVVVELIKEEMELSRYNQEQSAALMQGVVQDSILKAIESLTNKVA